MNQKRNLLFVAFVGLIVIIAAYQYSLPPAYNGTQIEPPKQMPDFSLSSTSGTSRLSDFNGKVTVLFFGFTHCTDICPATLAKLSSALAKIGDHANDVNVVFISVDYKRDTPQITAEYAKKFSSGFIGLAGSQAEIDTVTKQYGIYYKLGDPDPQGNFDVEHTASILVLDRLGRLEMTWSPDQQPSEIAADIENLVIK